MKRALCVLALCAAGCNALPEDDLPERTNQNLANENSGGGDANSAADAAKQRAEADKKRQGYLNTKHPNERGQSFNQRQTLYAAIRDVYETAKADVWPPTDEFRPSPFANEYISGLYQGRYGENYYFAPKKGEWDTDRKIWLTTVHKDDFPPKALDGGVWGSVHNHTMGHGPESPVDDQGLNLTPVWIVTSDGKIYVYPPQSGKVKNFGTIDGKGNIVTAYNTLEDAVNPNFDAYAQASGGGSCNFWCWAGIILGVTGGGTATAAVIGNASSTGDGCCYGPPAGGYPPGSDPTQICRRPDGDSCT